MLLYHQLAIDRLWFKKSVEELLTVILSHYAPNWADNLQLY